MDVQNIHWKNIDFVGAANSPYFDGTIDGSSKASQDPCAIYLENCTIGTSDNNVSRYIFNTNTNFEGGSFCTDVTATAYSKPFIGLTLARSCTAENVSEDTFTNTKAVINCILELSQLPSGNTGHPDVYQVVNSGVTPERTVTTENNIVYGLQCYQTNAPILFTSNLDLLKDCAFVNIYSETLGYVSQFRDCNLQHILILNYHQNLDAGNVATDGNNFLIEELEGNKSGVGFYVNYNNVRVENCSFWVSYIIEGDYPSGHLDPTGNSNAGDPIDIVTDNCSNAKPGTSGFSNVEYTSRGWTDAFEDTAAGSKNVPCDIFNRPRSTTGTADRGAFEGDPAGLFPISTSLIPGSEVPGSWATTAGDGSQVGSINNRFGSMKAMGHWTDPGFDDVASGSRTISLMADHANGIASVSFTANGGSPVVVTSRDSSGHFTTILDVSQTEVEVRAVITPIGDGQVTVMQGNRLISDDWSTDPDSVYGKASRSLTIFGGRTVTTVQANSISTLYSAISAATGPTNIELAAGTYDLSDQNTNAYNTSVNGWVTVKPASGAAVTITCTAGLPGSGKMPSTQGLKFDGIDFILATGDTSGGSGSYTAPSWPTFTSYAAHKLWVDSCTLNGQLTYTNGTPDQTFGDSPFFRDVHHQWTTSSSVDNTGGGSPIRGAQNEYVVSVDIAWGNASDDLFSNSAAVSNVTVSNLNGLGTQYHTDTFQLYTNLSGKKIKDLIINKMDCWAPHAGGGQGLFTDGAVGDGVDGMVVRDCTLANPQGAVKLEWGKNGNAVELDNIAFIDCILDPSGQRWYNDDPAVPANDLVNNGDVLFKNCISAADRNSVPAWASSPFFPGSAVDTQLTSPGRALGADLADGDVSTGDPYWSPYDAYLVGPDGVYATTQSNGTIDGGGTGSLFEFNSSSSGYLGTVTDVANWPDAAVSSDLPLSNAVTFSNTDPWYITYGIEGVAKTSGGHLLVTFTNSSTRTAFYASSGFNIDPSSGLPFASTGTFGEQDVTFSSNPSRGSSSSRWLSPSPSLSSWWTDIDNGATVEATTASGITWEDFSVAQSEINAASGSIDFGDRHFRPAVGVDGHIDVPFDFSITGGTFTAGVEITGWVDQGSGIWRGSIPTGHAAEIVGYEYLVDYNHMFDRKKLTTSDGAVDPVLARYQTGPTDFTFENALSYNSGFWGAQAPNLASGQTVHTVSGDNVTDAEITGFTLSPTVEPAATMKAEFEAEIDVNNPTAYSIMFQAGANRIAVARIATYNQSTGEVGFGSGAGITFTGYMPFTVTGSNTYITQDREYSIDVQNNYVYYRPIGGAQPTDTFLITGSNQGAGIFSFPSSNSGFPVNDFINVEMYGTSSMTASVAYGITGSAGSQRINLQGCTLGYGSGLVRAGGCSAEVTDGSATGSSFTGNTLFKYNQIGLVIAEGASVTNNICIYPAARSFCYASCNDGYHGSAGKNYVPNKLTFTGNYLFAPCCNHGQALSAYEGSFLNCDIKNNIIRGMRAAISWQGGNTLPNPVTGTSALTIEDNWMVYDQEIDRLGGGQATVAFNGGNDNWLSSPQNHTFTMARNGQYLPQSMYDPALLGGNDPWIDIGAMRITMAPYNNCPTNVINNTGFVAAAVSGSNSNSRAGGNAFVAYDFTTGLDKTYTATDIAWRTESITPTQAYSELQALSVVSADTTVNALSGGPAGPRWSSFPTLSELGDLNHDWSSTYTATGNAVPTGTLITAADTDDRDYRPTSRNWDIATQTYYNTDSKIGYSMPYPLDGETPTQLSSMNPDVAYSFGNSTGLTDIISSETASGRVGNVRLTIQLKNPPGGVNPWTSDITNAGAFRTAYGSQIEVHTIIEGTEYSMLLSDAGVSGSNMRFNNLQDSNGNVLTFAMAQAAADSTQAQLWMDLPPLP